MKYTINISLLNLFEDKLASFKKKFAKYGYGEIVYSVSEPRKEESGEKKGQLVVDVEVEASYKINDYEFVASLEYSEELKENMIKKPNEGTYVPDIYRTRTFCDHCGVNRSRKYTVLLRNTVTGEYVQVGKSCVKDYLGVDIGNYASYLSFFDDLEDYNDSISGASGVSLKQAYDFEDIILQTLEYVKRFGYISKQQAYDSDAVATSTQVWHAINHDKDFYGNIMYEEYEISKESKESFADIAEYLNGAGDQSDYVHNLKMLMNMPYIDGKNFGLVVSVVGWFLREKHKMDEKANKTKASSEYIGSIGDKVEFTAVPTCVFSSESSFGMFYIYKFNCNNNIIVWKTSKPLADVVTTIRGTVKSTEEFRGEKQTEVTRCRIISVSDRCE